MAAPVSYHGWDRRYGVAAAEDVLAVLREVAETDEFILKSRAQALEAAIAARTGAAHAVACANGTGALTLVLTALGIGRGDEVVTPAFSFVASASPIALTGAKPVFADVDEATGTLDPAAAAAAVSARTRALLPAHLFSCAAPMGALRALANRHGLALVEDSAVSLGAVVGADEPSAVVGADGPSAVVGADGPSAEVGGRPAGRHGDAGVFSFFPGKPLGGVGDGGMVVTDDEALATGVRMLRNHGQDLAVRFLHHRVGFNCRMDELVAGYLLRALPRLDAALARRRQLAQRYERRLRPLAPRVVPPPAGPGADFRGRAVYSYVVRADDRDGLRTHLRERGIETAVHYPRPLHLQPVFASLGHRRGDFPVAELLAATSLALPLYQGLTDAEVDRVCDAIEEWAS